MSRVNSLFRISEKKLTENKNEKFILTKHLKRSNVRI